MQLAISQLTDLNSLIVKLIVQALYMLDNGGYRSQSGYPRQPISPRPNALVGPCYECNGTHLVKDFPIQKEKEVATAAYCPNKPTKTKASLGLVEVIPSPSSSKIESLRLYH